MNIELLERLCTACGVSGDEDDIRDIILEEIKPYTDELKVDSLGNILAFKKGKQRAKSKLLISAHMDEVGFIVTNIESNGTLKFAEVGGIDKKAACGKAVLIGKNKLPGVIGAVPVHVLKADERAKNPSIDSLYIDIGADTKEQAEKCVSLGDCVYFDSVFEADERIIGKAIDDRAGCMALIEMLQSELEYDTYFSFVVQEEIGLRGAKGAAFTLNPDTAIVVEATTASDIPDVSGADKVCSVGSGAVVSFMDGATMYDRTLYKLIMDNAKQAGIPVQTKTKIAGGNDAGAIHQSRGGVRTAAISVPCRYLHSSSSLISRDDLQAVCDTLKLAAELAAGNDLLVDESNRSIAEKYLDKPNPFACRILSQLLAYGTGEHFLEHWVQLEDNKPRAVISRMDGNITIFCENVNNELLEFIDAVGYNAVFADKELFPQYWNGEVYEVYRKSETENSDNIDINPTIREIYSVLERCRGEGFEVPDFDSFYPDMSHRVRHNLSRVLAYRLDGQAIACCMTSAETDNCAIISGVACLPECRGKGYASKLVAKIVESLGDRDIFVFCREELVGFYNRLGFIVE